MSGPLVLVTLHATAPSARFVKVTGPDCQVAHIAMRVLDCERERLGEELARRGADRGHLRGVEAADRLGEAVGAEAQVAPEHAERGAGDGDRGVGRDESVILVERAS